MLRDIIYFTDEEFECPCCGQQLISQRMVSMLDSVRSFMGEPMHINSGFRCIKHNMDVFGSVTSSHRIGLAVDIRCTTSGYRDRLLIALRAVGFKRIGIRKDFIHVDVDPSKKQGVTWVY
jgi:uncharacterized protein YcbK (DUF882 family)